MTKKRVQLLVKQLKFVFDEVRIVDVQMKNQIIIDDSGEWMKEPYKCYAIWNRNRRCENCVSAKAFSNRSKESKFEFVNKDLYYVVSRYIEVEKKSYVIEMVSNIREGVMVGAYGKEELVQKILDFNKKVYFDPLTGVYNRQYYEEQVCRLNQADAVAIVDIDNFKNINDTYGHHVGDDAIKSVAYSLINNTKKTDTVIRFGGDEFVIVFLEAVVDEFYKGLEQIRSMVEDAIMEEHPKVKITISIGGVFCHDIKRSMLVEADKMLYKAKKLKNKVEILEI